MGSKEDTVGSDQNGTVTDRRILARDARHLARPPETRAAVDSPDYAQRLAPRDDDASDLRHALQAEKSVRDERIRRSLEEASRIAETGRRPEFED